MHECWDEGVLGAVSPIMSNTPRRPSSLVHCQAHGCGAHSCLQESIGCDGGTVTYECVGATASVDVAPAVLASQCLILCLGGLCCCRGRRRAAAAAAQPGRQSLSAAFQISVGRLASVACFVWCLAEVGGAISVTQGCDLGAAGERRQVLEQLQQLQQLPLCACCDYRHSTTIIIVVRGSRCSLNQMAAAAL